MVRSRARSPAPYSKSKPISESRLLANAISTSYRPGRSGRRGTRRIAVPPASAIVKPAPSTMLAADTMRGRSAAVVVAVPGDEAADAFGERRRRREADVTGEILNLGARCGHVAGFRVAHHLLGLSPKLVLDQSDRRVDLDLRREADGLFAAQRVLDRIDDAILHLLGEVGMHRQADHLGGEALGDGQSVAGARIMLVGGLAVERLRVVDRGRDAGALEGGLERVTVVTRDPDRVLGPHRGRALRHLRHDGHLAQKIVVAPGDALARLDLVAKDLELLDQHRGLDGVEPAVEADAHVLVFVGALTVHADRAQHRGELRILAEDRPAVAVATERLCRKKARRRDLADGADIAAAIRGAEALGGVAQHPQALAGADRLDVVVIRRLAEKVDGDDARGPEIHPPRGRHRKLEARRVEVEAVLDDVAEDRGRPEPRHPLGPPREGEARANHPIPGAQSLSHQHHTSAVAAKVKLGQTTASPGRMPFAISTMASASVPFAQEMTWLAPQKAASSVSSSATSGPRM